MTGQPPRRRRQYAALGVLVAALTGVGVIAVTALDGGVTYYRTPSELQGGGQDEGSVRVGGMVLPGSLVESVEGSTLLLTDGATDLSVRYPHRFPAVVQEGEGALVEGRLDSGGVLQADTILLRHSNEYRPAGTDP